MRPSIPRETQRRVPSGLIGVGVALFAATAVGWGSDYEVLLLISTVLWLHRGLREVGYMTEHWWQWALGLQGS